jgi:electron transfer flavoprotein alpha subunit
MKKEIWTYLETDGRGELLPTSIELVARAKVIAAAAEQAEEEKYTICALLAGADHDALQNATEKALGAGADRAVLIEGPELAVYRAEYYSDAVGELAEKEKPQMILFERTTDGMDLAPRLAARLGAGMISDCVDLAAEDGKLLWIRHAFGGTAAVSASFREQESTQIISIRPGSFGGMTGRGSEAAGQPDTERSVPEKDGAVSLVNYNSADRAGRAAGERIAAPKLVEVLEAAADRGMDPASARVIVAGGNGAGPEGFKLIEELAELLHGAVGASRVAVDKGWISHAHLIGQSGITVTPDLYINCGISGSVQHIVGMRDAKCVVSINKDPKALIFNVSDYGIVGDLHKVLPALIAEIRRHRG